MRRNFLRRYTFCITIFIFVLSISFTGPVRARPDSHAPIGVMGEHGHKAGEMMPTQVDVGVEDNNLSLSNVFCPMFIEI